MFFVSVLISYIIEEEERFILEYGSALKGMGDSLANVAKESSSSDLGLSFLICEASSNLYSEKDRGAK